MLKICLLVIFFALASAHIGLQVVWNNNATLEDYECLAQNNISLIIAGVWSPWGKQAPSFMRTYNLSRAAGIPDFDAIFVMSDSYSPEDMCGQIVGALPADFNGTLWVILPAVWKRAVEERMSFLDTVIHTCQQHGLKMGITSAKNDWSIIFKDQYATSKTVQSLPVSYYHYDLQPSFDDWSNNSVAFGNWTAPTMKQYSAFKVGNCKTVVSSQTYYE